MNNKLYFIGIGGGALMVLGTFLPYFSVLFVQINLWGTGHSAFGANFDVADGLMPRALFFTITGLLIPIMYLFSARPAKVIGLILSCAAFGFVAYDYSQTMQVAGSGMGIIALGTLMGVTTGLLELRVARHNPSHEDRSIRRDDGLL